jgi:uncharacterized protein YjiS (DUF1127 family)
MLDTPPRSLVTNPNTASRPDFRYRTSLRFRTLCSGLLRVLSRNRQVRFVWRQAQQMQKWRKFLRSEYEMNESVMKDIGMTPEQIRAVLARRYAVRGTDFW